MKTLVLVEHDHHDIKDATWRALTAARQLSEHVDVLVIGAHCQAVVSVLQQQSGINKIRLVDNDCYEHQLAENSSSVIKQLAIDYDYLLAASTTFGKNVLPRVAALLDSAMISDVIKIVSPDTFIRPMYAGNILATVKTKDRLKILTIRSTAFSAAQTKTDIAVPVEKLNIVVPNQQSCFVSETLTQSSRPELTTARIIVSGGRGLKSQENFKLLEQLADKLGAAIGASRAAVDAGYAPNDYQVGQTGKVVAPELYIAVGISGAIQHLAGMKDSKVIVGINNDPDAPIFAVADYALVGDLFKLLPELTAALK